MTHRDRACETSGTQPQAVQRRVVGAELWETRSGVSTTVEDPAKTAGEI